MLSAVIAGDGGGKISSLDGAIDCGSKCSAVYAKSAQVTLVATATAGSLFDGWGGVCRGTTPTCLVSMDSASSATASFVPSGLRNAPVDAVIAAMPANSWKALPKTFMKDVCPQPYSKYNCENVVAAWSGGAYDERRDRMVIYGGGHSDSFYNNVFAFDLPSMQWQRLSDLPAGVSTSTPPASWNDSRLESCGYYPKGEVSLTGDVMLSSGSYVDPDKCFLEPVLSQLDLQQPRSSHSYGKVVVDRLNDRYCYLGGGTYPGAQTDSRGTDCFDPESRRWERVAMRPSSVTGRGNVALDAAGVFWYFTDATGAIGRYDPTKRAWTALGSLNYEAGGGADVDRQRNHFYALATDNGSTYVLRRYDLATAVKNVMPTPSVVAATGTAPSGLGTRPGFVYADARDRFFAWGGGRNLFVFDPQAKSWSVLAGSGDDPGPQQEAGTYGRFRYSPKRNVFVLVNGASQEVFIYKPAE